MTRMQLSSSHSHCKLKYVWYVCLDKLLGNLSCYKLGAKLVLRMYLALRLWSVIVIAWSIVSFDWLADQGSLESCHVIFRHQPGWSSPTCPMDLRQFPRCLQQVGDRSWPTWHSARCPRISLLEHLLLRETLASRSWLHLTLKRKRKSSQPSWQTDDLRWWPSSACSSGKWVCMINQYSSSCCLCCK